MPRFLRYLLPNLVTMASLTFGMLSILATLAGQYVDAAWYIVFSVLTDKLDGFVARLVKGTSEFGVQLDSFADFLNFGIAPAAMWYSYLSLPGSPLAEGTEHFLMAIACAIWVLAVTFRLARYNIVGDDPRCKRIFFGVPTTLMGGLLVALFLALHKYGADFASVPQTWNDPYLVPGLSISTGVWKIWPALLALGAFLMASAVKIPKLGLSKSKVLSAFILGNVLLGYVCGALRVIPELLWADATHWTSSAINWGMLYREVRPLRPPPIFPREDHPPHKRPQRPEEDQLPEEDEEQAHDGEPVSPT
jgi:CDP-diacylglycerol--serine O-phosphatidyltransferase